MAEVVVGPIIQVLLDNLVKLSLEKIDLVRHFKRDLENLRINFEMANKVLQDAEKRQVDSVVKIWLREVEALAFSADNVIDEIDYHLLSKKVGATKNKTWKKKFKSFFSSSSNNFNEMKSSFSPSTLGRRINDINEKLKSINQQASGFGFPTRLAVSRSYASGSMETDSFAVDPIFHGRDNDVLSIVNKLTCITPSPDEEALSVLPIVGMGGLGKTTLAKQVFGHKRMISHFGDNRVWVYVSRKFDDRNIFKNIIQSLTKENFKFETREGLLTKLQQHLRTNRYLLVLDDVWIDDNEIWDNFVNSLMRISSGTGSYIIVTSRIEMDASSIVKTLPVHKLKGLSEYDCWLIIKAKVRDNSLEFETGRNIARRCKGLPLAAKLIGGLLYKKSKDEWLEIEQNWLPNVGDDLNPVSKILKLSFDNLSSSSLKKCFAYCSIFPKGYYIEKQLLIELWMAEGFLQTEHQKSNINMETTGNKNFSLLLRNSLLQVVMSDDYDNVTHCNMHDLVHDLAYSILHENVKDDVSRRRYVGYDSSGDGLLYVPKKKEGDVRTLFFNGKVSDMKFPDFESLRTLTLVSKEDNTEKLPASIRELKHLRYLDVSEVRYLLDSIGELYHLQTLRAPPEWMHVFFKKLPDSLSCLISLRHLHIPCNIELPPGIGKLTSLQTLPHFHVGSEKGCRISELGNLKHLKGELTIHNLENVRDKDEAKNADLLGKSGIYMLRLVWDKSRESAKANDQSVLEGLQLHTHLKTLDIFGFKGKSLSLLEELRNVMEIRLTNCSECEELPMLGQLRCLKALRLSGLTNVKSIGSSFYGNIDNGERDTIAIVFRVLERLELCDMPDLKEWDDGVVFPSLKYLKIDGCRELISAPSDFPCLEELEIQDMESRLALENICGIKLASLIRLTIKNIEGMECLPDRLFSNNNNLTWLNISDCPKMTHLVPHLGDGGAPSRLRKLEIYKCPSLRQLPDDLYRLISLEKLSIKLCANLESISSGGGGGQQQGFTSLRDLKISDCEALTSLPIEIVVSCLPSLEKLTLSELSSIDNFHMVIRRLHEMTRLISLVIERVPIGIDELSIRNTLNGPLSLQYLKVGPFSSDSSNDSFNEIVGDMLLQCNSLRCLKLKGMGHWECLPGQLQHLASLEKLWLKGFGIKELPNWVGNLSFLERLYMSNCEMIRHLPELLGNLSSLKELRLSNCIKLSQLPSKQAMIGLSKLIDLEIWKCPLLLKKKRSNNDINEVPRIVNSEWQKISNIRRLQVYVDGHLI